MTARAAVLTVSTSRSAGGVDDTSGPALAAWAERELGVEVTEREIVSDDRAAIEALLERWADSGRIDLILTTGGTGFSPSDLTPEATRAAVEREAPGIAEAMRLASAEHTDLWMVSRGVAGTRGRTLIVNFPGSPKSIPEAGAALVKAIPHALRLLASEPR